MIRAVRCTLCSMICDPTIEDATAHAEQHLEIYYQLAREFGYHAGRPPSPAFISITLPEPALPTCIHSLTYNSPRMKWCVECGYVLHRTETP